MKTSQRIKEIRIDLDKTQQEVANGIGIDRKTYCRYENDQHEIRVDVLISLAKYYNLSLEYVAGITDVKTKLYHTTNAITVKQEELLKAYAAHPEHQNTIDKILDI